MNRQLIRRLIVVAGSACMVAGGAPSVLAATAHHGSAVRRAQQVPGSALGALDLTATAYAVRTPFYSTGGEDFEAEAPYAQSTLGIGGVGHGLTSVMWPGDTGGHGGDVLDLLNVPAPPSVKKQLNDPVKAEAQTSVGAPTVQQSGPGYAMSATATADRVSAESRAAGSAVPVAGKLLGELDSATSSTVTGVRTVQTRATSTVKDISIAKVLTIDQITSTGVATSNAKTAAAHTSTTITGAAVAGIPVSIDGTGIHVDKSKLPNPLSTATAIVNRALQQAGISLVVTRPTQQTDGAGATATSGSLEVKFSNKQFAANNDTGTLLILGGVSVAADAGLGYPYRPPAPLHSSPAAPPAGTAAPTGSGSGAGGSLPVANSSGAGAAPAGAPQVAAAPGSNPELAGQSLPLPGGVKVWWAVLMLLGAGLVWFALRRLPDQVLETGDLGCRLERP